jgi:tetraacyldisaccharide 4'-kinase
VRRVRVSLLLASRAFALAARARGAAYDLGALPVERVGGAVVISVGSLRAGGSGKTPFTLWLAGELARSGVPAAIALRGYKGSLSARGGVVSRGSGPLVSPLEAGDEAYLLASRAPAGVAVHVGADRVAAARRAVREGARAVVLDDGFQHRRLHRDCDIVLVCPEDLDPAARPLPQGALRETGAALRRAHVVAGWEEEWRGREDAPEVLAASDTTGLAGVGFALEPLPPPGRRVFLFAGIARPERFVRAARAAGFDVAGTRFFPDHHPYDARDLAEIAGGARRSAAETLLTTEKDLARIAPARNLPPVRALRLDVRIAKGAASLAARLRGAGLAATFVGA